MELETEKPKKREAKTYTVTLKKAAFIDGKQIGNEGGTVQVDADTRKKLKRSGVIYEDAE